MKENARISGLNQSCLCYGGNFENGSFNLYASLWITLLLSITVNNAYIVYVGNSRFLMQERLSLCI